MDQPLLFNFAKYLHNIKKESEPESDDNGLIPPSIHCPAGRPKKKEIKGLLGMRFRCAHLNIVAVKNLGTRRGPTGL